MKPIEKYTNEDLLDRLLGEVGEGWEAPAEQAELLRRLETGAQAIRERDAMVAKCNSIKDFVVDYCPRTYTADEYTGWLNGHLATAEFVLAARTKGQEEGKNE